MFLGKNDGCKFILNFEEILLHFFFLIVGWLINSFVYNKRNHIINKKWKGKKTWKESL